MTKRLDKLKWKADEFGELLNDLQQELRSENTGKEVEMWLTTLQSRLESLYWTLENLQREVQTSDSQRLSSLASSGESAESIAALLLGGNVPIVQDLLPRSTLRLREESLPETLITSMLNVLLSQLSESNQGTSSSIIQERVGTETATPTSESVSVKDSELMQ